jgi:tetratricopeptide (TPR) repeat protein
MEPSPPTVTPSGRTCPQCDRSIPPGQFECPHCKPASDLATETILALSLLGLAVLFALTGITARLYHAKYESLGSEWYARGEADLKAGKAEAAITGFRTALVYTRDSDLYQLSLAQALIAANRTDEAREYLASLWQLHPEDAVINLELGRLATRTGNVDDALRYFHNAVYADWGSQDPAESRRAARMELYNFLLSRGARAQAQAELVAMAAELPPDPALYTQMGGFFLNAGDYPRALKEFEEALHLGGGGEAALAGAGEAEYLQGDYRQARHYLDRAHREDPSDPRLSEMLDQTNVILQADPFEPGLPIEERNRRTIEAFNQALARLAACGMPVESAEAAGPTPPADLSLIPFYDRARALRPQARMEMLLRNPDLVAKIMDLAFQIEQTTAHECRPPVPLDRALILLARQHESSGK